MLERLYVHNFKCLVNFDLRIGPLSLFLGPNGSGKSALLEALRAVQTFVSGEARVPALFRDGDRTRWQQSPLQNFELEVRGPDGLYRYELTIEHPAAGRRARVHHERLWLDGNPLLRFESSGDVHLYRDDHSEGPIYPFDRSQSALASIWPRADNQKLTWFKERLGRLIIIQINPMIMSAESAQEAVRPSARMENFVSWYRRLSQDQGKTFELTHALREVLDGFDYFRFVEAGEEHRVLRAHFSGPSDDAPPVEYRFDELSDGQRVLIVLYTLLYHLRGMGYTLCIDEPENFVALPEIQPWLTTLYDLCSAGELQALLISHHPELIDYLAPTAGYWFARQENGPVRVRPVAQTPVGEIPLSEFIARGWLDDQT